MRLDAFWKACSVDHGEGGTFVEVWSHFAVNFGTYYMYIQIKFEKRSKTYLFRRRNPLISRIIVVVILKFLSLEREYA